MVEKKEKIASSSSFDISASDKRWSVKYRELFKKIKTPDESTRQFLPNADKNMYHFLNKLTSESKESCFDFFKLPDDYQSKVDKGVETLSEMSENAVWTAEKITYRAEKVKKNTRIMTIHSTKIRDRRVKRIMKEQRETPLAATDHSGGYDGYKKMAINWLREMEKVEKFVYDYAIDDFYRSGEFEQNVIGASLANLGDDPLVKIFMHASVNTQGLSSPYTYLGFRWSVFMLHIEDFRGLNSCNIVYRGSPKLWILIPRRHLRLLQEKLAKKLQITELAVREKQFFVHPVLLDELKIDYEICIQPEGFGICTHSAVFHEGANMGWNFASARNLALDEYLINLREPDDDTETFSDGNKLPEAVDITANLSDISDSEEEPDESTQKKIEPTQEAVGYVRMTVEYMARFLEFRDKVLKQRESLNSSTEPMDHSGNDDEHANLKEQLEAAEVEREKALAEAQDAKNQLKNSNSEIEQIRSAMTLEKDAELASLRHIVNDSSETMCQPRSLVDTLRSEVNAKDDQLKAVKDEYQSLQRANNDLKKAIENERSEHDRAIKRLTRVANGGNRIATEALRTVTRTKDDQISQLQKENTLLKSKLVELENGKARKGKDAKPAKTFPCTVNKCKIICSSAGHRAHHIDVEHIGKRFSCDACGRGFTYKRALRAHLSSFGHTSQFQFEVPKKNFTSHGPAVEEQCWNVSYQRRNVQFIRNQTLLPSYRNVVTAAKAPKYPNLPTIEDGDEWTYKNRRTMQEIVPNLFLGPYASATRNNLEKMKEAGLTHVVCVRSEAEAHLIRANHQDHFQYLIVQMDDSPLEPIIPKVKTVSTFVDKCLNTGGKVLVHGNAGMSRSPTLVIGYIMSKYGVSFKKASKYVQTKRFCIAVTEACRQQLIEYEPIYLAMNGAQNNSANPEFRNTKRKIEEVDAEENNGNNENDGARLKIDDEDDDSNLVEMGD